MTHAGTVELSPVAETYCLHQPMVGTSWCEDELPIAPAGAIAEWLSREPCNSCGGQGCVIVYEARLIEYPIIDGEVGMGVVIDDFRDADEQS